MSHIDFSKVVAKNGDDYEEVSSGNAPAGFYDKYNRSKFYYLKIFKWRSYYA